MSNIVKRLRVANDQYLKERAATRKFSPQDLKLAEPKIKKYIADGKKRIADVTKYESEAAVRKRFLHFLEMSMDGDTVTKDDVESACEAYDYDVESDE